MNYQNLKGYDLQSYRKLVSLRKKAKKVNLKIQKLTKEDKFIAITSDGLTKFFDNLDDMKDFVFKFSLVEKAILEE